MNRVIEELLGAYDAHDVKALRVLYAEDAVIRVGELEFHGRDRIAAFWTSWFAAFPDVSSTIERATSEGRRVVLDWTERGTHRRQLRLGDFSVPARGHLLCWRGVSIYELDEGEIASVDYFVDRLELARQLVKPVAASLAFWQRLSRAGASVNSKGRRRDVRHISQ